VWRCWTPRAAVAACTCICRSAGSTGATGRTSEPPVFSSPPENAVQHPHYDAYEKWAKDDHEGTIWKGTKKELIDAYDRAFSEHKGGVNDTKG